MSHKIKIITVKPGHSSRNNPGVRIIGAGKEGKEILNHTGLLSGALERQARTLRNNSGDKQSGKTDLHEPFTITEIADSGNFKTLLQNSRLVFLAGFRTDRDFLKTRNCIIESLPEKAFCFTMALNDGPAQETIVAGDRECLITPAGKSEKAPCHFLLDFVSWLFFPPLVNCDWADIQACCMGRKMKLNQFEAGTPDYIAEFREFLDKQKTGLKKAENTLFHAACNPSIVPVREIFRLFEELENHTKKESRILLLENRNPDIEILRISLLSSH